MLTLLQVSPECADLIARMLTADPAQRISVPETLGHPWVTRGIGQLDRLNGGLLTLMGLAGPPPPAEDALSSNSVAAGRPPLRRRAAASPLRPHNFLLDVEPMAGPAAAGRSASSTGYGAAAPCRGRAASLDLPRGNSGSYRPIGAAAANAAHMRAGGCRQSLAEIARLLSAAQAATAAEQRRAVRSMDLAGEARRAAAARCQPAWQCEWDSVCTSSM